MSHNFFLNSIHLDIAIARWFYNMAYNLHCSLGVTIQNKPFITKKYIYINK